ncbi:hypothetical protein BASA50_004223 [Batrachochytrium salamandrivorans]|uniref:SH3 domain-containing protein n=1 Tax=Batrachochytrium salamandrivorans TaxID=1357716 RepID=A0ABQ8FGF9_9FUNG|nr:hypothetical protein BASA50_004223 [Batrachochytrium salamandrivorans]
MTIRGAALAAVAGLLLAPAVVAAVETCSTPNGAPLQLTVINGGASPVQLVRLNYNCVREPLALLQPNGRSTQPTFINREWMVCDPRNISMVIARFTPTSVASSEWRVGGVRPLPPVSPPPVSPPPVSPPPSVSIASVSSAPTHFAQGSLSPTLQQQRPASPVVAPVAASVVPVIQSDASSPTPDLIGFQSNTETKSSNSSDSHSNTWIIAIYVVVSAMALSAMIIGYVVFRGTRRRSVGSSDQGFGNIKYDISSNNSNSSSNNMAQVPVKSTQMNNVITSGGNHDSSDLCLATDSSLGYEEQQQMQQMQQDQQQQQYQQDQQMQQDQQQQQMHASTSVISVEGQTHQKQESHPQEPKTLNHLVAVGANQDLPSTAPGTTILATPPTAAAQMEIAESNSDIHATHANIVPNNHRSSSLGSMQYDILKETDEYKSLAVTELPPPQQQQQHSSLSIGSLHSVWWGYQARQPDELSVQYGDAVRFNAVFDDGWVMVTGKDNLSGVIPQACLNRSLGA